MTAADSGEFSAFYRHEYVPLVRWLIRRGACCMADAEDAAQRALTEVWCRWTDVGNRHGYLYQAAVNELGHLRRAGRYQAIAARRAGHLAGQHADAELPARVQASAVREHLLALPPEQRMALACHYDQEAQPAGEAATIRSNLRHARARLRQLAAAAEPDLRERILRQAYAEMRAGNLSPPGARPVISHSWARSALVLTDPGHGPVLAPLSRDDLAVRRSISPLRAVAPAVCVQQADATGLMMVITDADGWLLWRAGERKARDRGDRDGHIEGACLTERSIGTSGVSLALAARHPVLVFGAEHYAPALHDLACAAAPVYHPRSGCLLGVLNLTAPPDVANRGLLRHVDQVARQVQRQIAGPGQ